MARKTIKGLEVIITDLEKRLNEQNILSGRFFVAGGGFGVCPQEA